MLWKKLFMVCLLFGLGFCMAQDQKEQSMPLDLKATGKGIINPEATNKAQAKMMAERSAKVDAMRNLLAKIQSVLSETESKDKVKGILAGHRFQNMQYSEDGTSVSVEVWIPLEELLKNYYQSILSLEDAQAKAKEWEEKSQKNAQEMEKLRAEMDAYKQEQEKILEEKNKQIQNMEKSLEKDKIEKEDKILETEKQEKENALLRQKKQEELVLLQEQKIAEQDSQILLQKKKIEELENAAQSLHARYLEQNKALLAFEEHKKKFIEPSQELKQGQEALEKQLQECLAEKKLLTQKIEEIAPGYVALQSEKENAVEELKKVQQEQSELQENFKKLIEILGHVHYENKDILSKYHDAVKNLLEKESELSKVRENIEVYKMRLQNVQKSLDEAKQKYNMLSESYKNSISQNRVVMESLSKKDVLEKTIREIYVNQQIFSSKMQSVENFLQRMEAFLNQDY